MKLEINFGDCDIEIQESWLKNIINKVFLYLKQEKVFNTEEKNVSLSIAFVDRKTIKEINKKYRQKDEPTDVLSFCYEHTPDQLEGEMILCPEIIQDNAREDKIDWQDELRKNIVHSTLHIIGYEHGREMFDLQDKILREV